MPRHKGSTNEFRQLQEREIIAAYRNIFTKYGGIIAARQLYELVAHAPASRFFVSERRAAEVIQQMLQGKLPLLPRSTNQRMYFEIYHRTRLVMEQQPGISVTAAVTTIVRNPAPEMYISPRHIQEIIKEHQTQCYNTRKQRLHHSSMQ